MKPLALVPYTDLLQTSKKWAILFGCWSNGKRNIIQILQLIFIFIVSFLNMITNTINFLRCKGDLNCMMDTVTHLSVIVGSIYFLIVHLMYENVCHRSIEFLGELREKFSTREETGKMEKLSRLVTNIMYAYCNIGLVIYVLVPVVSYDYCTKHTNQFNKLDMFTCGLAMPAWFPFDVTESPGYEVALTFQAIAATFSIHIVIHPLTIHWNLILHIIVHVRVLKANLKNIRKKPAEERFPLLQHCVKHHTAIINFINPVLDTCNKLLFFNTVFIVIILTATGFQMIKIVIAADYWNFCKYMIMLAGWSAVLLIHSVIGQKLIDETWEIMDYAYNIKWYYESITFQKMILLIMLRANHPIVLKSASLTENSLANFNKVMSSIYSYITLLLNYLD